MTGSCTLTINLSLTIQVLGCQGLGGSFGLRGFRVTRFITAHLDGACRLAADSQMGGAAPASNSPATAVEQHHLDVVLLGHGDDALLSLEQRPGGGEAAGILAGVGVA